MRRRFISESKIVFDYNDYMTIEALEDRVTVKLDIRNTSVMYGINGRGWKSYRQSITINRGDLLSFKYVVPQGDGFNNKFLISGPCNLKGNCLSLIFGDDKNYDLSGYQFYCLSYLFGEAPIISVDASFLPATTLTIGCYDGMFYGCTSLVNAPELPATTLANYCYRYMFQNCTSLATAPALPATTLADGCYYYMFRNCTKLKYIKMLAVDIPADSCLSGWVSGVASTGTFVKNPNMTSLPRGSSGIPSGWTVVNDGEESGGVLITFTIDGTEYQAEEGMTWGEWVDSEYNVDNYTSDSDYVLTPNGIFLVVIGGTSVTPTDVIIEEQEYNITLT